MRCKRDRAWESCATRPGSGRRAALLCLLAALAVAASFALAGCKYSDVLTQHTEDPTAEVDEGAEPIYRPNPESDIEMDMANFSLDADAEDQDTQIAMLPHYDPDAPDNGPTLQRKKSEETPHDEEASEGEESEEEADRDGTGADENAETSGETSDSDEEGDGGGDNDTDPNPDAQGNNTGENENPESENTLDDDDSDESTDSDDSGGGGNTVVVDPDEGTTTETSKGTVAAVGEYATITQMLGGAGALVACDETWLKARKADGAFDGELDKVQVAFSGDGSSSGCCDIDLLINTLKPSVVLYDGTNPALSSSERSQLEEAGISVQDVPTLGKTTTEDSTVTAAVQEVANVLSGASGLQFDPTDKLTDYIEFHDNALKACYKANDGYSYKVTSGSYNRLYQKSALAGLDDSTTTRVTTVYVDDLYSPSVSEAKIAQTATTDSGIIKLAHDDETLNVSDGVALSVKGESGSYQLIDYYLQLAGVVNNAYDRDQPDSGKRYILMPGNTASFGTSGDYGTRLAGTAYFYAAGESNVVGNWKALGDDDFRTTLVASEDIADKMAKSASRPKGLYNMEKSYRILVVPSGIAGSWAKGHIDSFLLAPWAFYLRDEASLDSAATYAKPFYSSLLRCDDWEGAIEDWNYVKTTGG